LFDFRIYDSILTLTEILEIVVGGPTVDSQSTHNKCQLTFETNQGSSEPDASGNGNVGAITGATFSSDNPAFGALATIDCVAPGSFHGNNLAEAFRNSAQLDLIQVVNEGEDIIWHLTANGVAVFNPVTYTSKALLGRYQGQTFAEAFPNPRRKNIFQIVGPGNNIVFFVNYQGVAQEI
jgi:hypothetical protein